jgi:cathepsin F
MRALLLCLALFALVAVASARKHADEDTLAAQWAAFRAKYNKQYATPAEAAKRFRVFKTNYGRMTQLNAEHGAPFPYGVTKFMDLTTKEFKRKYLMKGITFEEPEGPIAVPKQVLAAPKIPSNFDWGLNKSNIVTAVKNQEQCGSCWAFSATESIESVWAAAHPIQILAPQQIVDCDKNDDGCNGGWPYRAYQYIISAGGQEPESDYPYTAQNGKCKFSASDVVAKISSWKYVITAPSQENTTLLNYIATTGPVSICVYAEPWQYYQSGVITKGCSNQKSMIDHCVQLTGFWQMTGLNTWRIRNSWGTDWGMDGYIYIERGQDLCCVAQVVTVPAL